MRSLPVLLVALLAGAALAGCTNNDDDTEPTPVTSTPAASPSDPFVTPATPSPTPTQQTPDPALPLSSTTYALATSGVPTQAKPNQTAVFTLYVNGTRNATSDHVGAHYADNATTSPPATGRRDCAHVNGTLPGTFNVSCAFAATGAWHVFGHARVNESGDVVEWWATPFVVRVRDYNLTATAPANAQFGTNFTVSVNVTALGLSDNATTDHIGAHYFNDTEGSTTELAAGDCAHVAGGVVGTHTVDCNIAQGSGLPGTRTVYVRGHVRITEGEITLSWWSAPVQVTLQPVNIPLPGFP